MEKKLFAVHWNTLYQGASVALLWDDETWEIYKLPSSINIYGKKGELKLATFVQKKVTRSEIMKYLDKKVKELEAEL